VPIPLPSLDDRTFADLTGEARALIPALLPEWTDHNPSDPGIVLVELLAWLTEMLVYQADQVPDAHVEKFLALLGAPRDPDVGLEQATRAAVLGLRERYRAVTPADHEELVRTAWPAAGGAPVARVRCVPRRDLAATDAAVRAAAAPASVSVVVVPPRPDPAAGADDTGSAGTGSAGTGAGRVLPTPDPALLTGLAAFFEPRRLLTTRLHVVGPRYRAVRISADIVGRDDAAPEPVLAAARAALADFLDPLDGGPEGTGWPFGRPVWTSEVIAVLAGLPLVAYVEDATVTTDDPARVLLDGAGRPTGVALDPDELVAADTAGVAVWGSDGKQYGGGR
jgi:hypothetical protein